MKTQDILSKLSAKFGDMVQKEDLKAPDPYIVIDAASIAEVAQLLKNDKTLAFDSLMCLTGVDYEEHMEVVYNLHSTKRRHKITLKVELPRDNPTVPSVSNIWRTADWHEREAYDLFGIVFEGHPDLRRILLPDDWEGHPLRKDHTDAEDYRGWTIKKDKDYD